MLLNILHFGEKNAGDVAVPRGDIYRRARRRPASTPWSPPSPRPGHSRMPVFEDSLDTVIGMIHVKDLFAVQVGDAPPPDDIRTLMRTPLYVPESMGVLDLLARMRAERVHLAIVVDEFGGTEGLLTIEDVVEEIVGEIEDEHDEEVPGLLIPLEDGSGTPTPAPSWRTSPRRSTRASARSRRMSTRWAASPSSSPAACPQTGEMLEHPSGWRLEVTDSDTRRVRRLRLHPPGGRRSRPIERRLADDAVCRAAS